MAAGMFRLLLPLSEYHAPACCSAPTSPNAFVLFLHYGHAAHLLKPVCLQPALEKARSIHV